MAAFPGAKLVERRDNPGGDPGLSNEGDEGA
jgi:hypothetical protein